MSTRITDTMISRTVLNDLNDVSLRLSQTQERLSSGKQITRPSDDPYGTSRALTLRTDISGTQQYQRNIGEADGWLNVTDSALSNISDALQRARELAIQGATDSAGQSARDAAASEIDQLIDSIKQDANALRTTDLQGLDTNLDALSQARATVGATTNRLDAANTRLQQVEESQTKLLSDVEDADMAKTMVDYSMQQSVYQAALHAGANIVQQSLLDWLK